MNKCIAIACGLALAPLIAYGADADNAEFKTNKEKYSYSIGMSLGNNWKTSEVDVDLDFLVRGIKDVLAAKPTLLTDAQAKAQISQLSADLRQKAMEKRRLQGEKNKADGEAFLAANKAKPGIQTTPSGLQYKIVTEGKGEKPKPGDELIVNYRGTTIDGTEFDSSTNVLSRMVRGLPGLTEGLGLMKIGSKYQLFVPHQLGYGTNGSMRVGPCQTLLFDVELLGSKPPVVATPAPPTPVTSDIIKVPSAEEMKKGAQIEVIKKEDVDKLKAEAAKNSKPSQPKK